jgi:hypothetical protein
MRILIGMVKYKFLGSLFYQLTYANFILDAHYHPWIDMPIAAVLLFLSLLEFLRFSGRPTSTTRSR